MHFYPITTEDGTLSLYNLDVEDIYHSRIGAHTEAVGKFIVPSGIREFASNNNEVRILDICYGLGYNSKAAANEILKINPDIAVKITALEIDPIVVAFSSIIGSEIFDEKLNTRFFYEISKRINIQQNIDEYLQKSINIADEITPIIEGKIPFGCKLIPPADLRSFLHNIYYRTVSTRKSIDTNTDNISLSVDFFLEDARTALQMLTAQKMIKFDFIFLDPFTPAKVPMLWSVEVFKMLFELLDDNGNITTYTGAAPVRAAMLEAGFHIGNTAPVGKKSPGTIACKNPNLIKSPLSDKECGLLDTRAGVPYRDPSLSATNDGILGNREHEQQACGRVSSSAYLKISYYDIQHNGL